MLQDVHYIDLFDIQALEKLRWGHRGDLIVSAHEATQIQLPSHDAPRATTRKHGGMYCTQVCCMMLFHQQLSL